MRASNYYRAAEFYVRDDPHDPRSLEGWQSSHDCFAEAARLSDPPFEAVEIPYEERRRFPATSSESTTPESNAPPSSP